MSESAITGPTEHDGRHDDREKRGFFGRIARFVRQVGSELRRVVTPTREETIRYVWVVLIFVVVVTAMVTVEDLGFGKLAQWVFGS